MGRALSARWGARAAGSSPAPVWNHPRPSCPSPRRQGRGARPLTPHMLAAPRGAALMLFYLRSREKGRPRPSGAGRGARGAKAARLTGMRREEAALPPRPQPLRSLPSARLSPIKHPHGRRRPGPANVTGCGTRPRGPLQQHRDNPVGCWVGTGLGGGSLRKLRKCLPAVLCAWHRREIIANIASHGKTNTSKKYVKHQNTLKSMSDCLPS